LLHPNEGPIVHRDVSPGNILIGKNGKVKITDFGIARATQFASVTQPGILKGKYEYMAPEYIKGKKIDGRADLFSLGVVLYELLVGENPFTDILPHDIWKKIVSDEVTPPSKKIPAIPRTMDKLIVRALAKDPGKRFSNGKEMALALIPFVEDKMAAGVVSLIGQRVEKELQNQEQLQDLIIDDGGNRKAITIEEAGPANTTTGDIGPKTVENFNEVVNFFGERSNSPRKTGVFEFFLLLLEKKQKGLMVDLAALSGIFLENYSNLRPEVWKAAAKSSGEFQNEFANWLENKNLICNNLVQNIY